MAFPAFLRRQRSSDGRLGNLAVLSPDLGELLGVGDIQTRELPSLHFFSHLDCPSSPTPTQSKHKAPRIFVQASTQTTPKNALSLMKAPI
jgi:hypothetical protein